MAVATKTPAQGLDERQTAWGRRQADEIVAFQRMEMARATRGELMIRWIAGRCRLETYRRARRAFERTRQEYIEAGGLERDAFARLVSEKDTDWTCDRCHEAYRPFELTLRSTGNSPEIGPLTEAICAGCGANDPDGIDEWMARGPQ